LAFLLTEVLILSPKKWLFSLSNRFRLVTSQLRTTFGEAKKIFSQPIFRKNLMNSAKSSTLFEPMSGSAPHFLWVASLKWAVRHQKAGIHLME
jgi:hypothetical protein